MIDEGAMDFATARVKMVDNQIRTTDVTDLEILRAFLNVPRELFVPRERRDLATAVTSVLAAQAGAWAVRVHDVAATRDALRIARAWREGGE